MSLWSSLLETYDEVQNASGRGHQGYGNGDEAKKILLPLDHMSMPGQLRVILKSDGCLESIKKEAVAWTMIIPCTEESMGRTSKPVPHPLCDQLQYVDKVCDAKRTCMYLDQLAKWKGDDEKLNAIYRYVSEHSISKDAIQYGIQLTGKDEKIGVCFEVEIPGKACRPVADDPEIRNRWIEFQQREHAWAGTDIFGRDFYSQASNYPKNIVSTAGNAKLISANDNTNFTYRGRFGNRDEALRIDSETSQKIHSTLRWLVNNHATITDTQAIIIWAVKKPEENVVNPELNFAETLSHMLLNSESEQHDVVQDALIATDMNYAKRFRALLRGYGSPDFLQKHANKMAIVILDAATSGRLSVTFYRELRENEYLENILKWHTDTAWPLTYFERNQNGDKTSFKRTPYIGAPSFVDIINCTYDASDRSSKSYKRYAKYMKKRLIECMFGDRALPISILNAAFHKVTRPISYNEGGLVWERDFEIACSLWKKHFNDEAKRHHDSKEVSMELNLERKDRDYLYGRLLALADYFERGVLLKQQVDRPTNAVKLMSNFIAKPYSTWGALWKQLIPYLKTMNGAEWFQSGIDDVMALFEEGDFEDNKTLSPLFLLGYSSQRRSLRNPTRLHKDESDKQN